MKANCYECKHSGEVVGSCHSSCHHPVVKDNLALAAMLFFSGYTIFDIRCDPHGVRNGWFNWPLDFDPVWLEACEGFEQKGGEVAMNEASASDQSSAVSPTNATNATKTS